MYNEQHWLEHFFGKEEELKKDIKNGITIKKLMKKHHISFESLKEYLTKKNLYKKLKNKKELYYFDIYEKVLFYLKPNLVKKSGEKLLLQRNYKFSQKELSKLVGCNEKTISKIYKKFFKTYEESIAKSYIKHGCKEYKKLIKKKDDIKKFTTIYLIRPQEIAKYYNVKVNNLIGFMCLKKIPLLKKQGLYSEPITWLKLGFTYDTARRFGTKDSSNGRKKTIIKYLEKGIDIREKYKVLDRYHQEKIKIKAMKKIKKIIELLDKGLNMKTISVVLKIDVYSILRDIYYYRTDISRGLFKL